METNKKAPPSAAALGQAVAASYRSASPAKKALWIAGGLAAVCTAPYWGPAVWRSKTARRVLGAGVTTAVTHLS